MEGRRGKWRIGKWRGDGARVRVVRGDCVSFTVEYQRCTGQMECTPLEQESKVH